MDEFTGLIPLWCASKPSEYIFINERPNWDCVKCGKNFWRVPTKVDVARKNPFGEWKPLSVWVATTECFICSEPTKWLIDPDKPVCTDGSKPLGDLLCEHASEQGRIDDPDPLREDGDLTIRDDIVSPLSPDSVPFSEWCKRYGESDLQAYIRWLKDQQRRRAEDDDNRNDAS